MADGNNTQIAWVEAQILEVLNEKPGKSMNYKQISSRLGFFSKSDRELTLAALDELKATKQIYDSGKGNFHTLKKSEYTEGIIEFNKRGAGYLLMGEDKPDIHIPPGMTWPALNGDTVEVEIVSSKRKDKPEGKVVNVVKRKKSEYIGTIQVSDGFGFFVPDDTRSHTDFFIPKDKLRGVKNNYKAIVRITDWPKSAKNPNAEVVKVLGKAGENNTEIHAILLEFGLNPEFPEDVMNEVNKFSDHISEGEIADRKDFRETLTITIDPADAKDFDDAISLKVIDDNNFEIGVHIADVSHYVTEGSLIDKEAYKRATSVYLVDRVVPMLPEKLSNELCSLRPNEDSLCFSAVFNMDKNGKILKEWFGKTIIHSHRRFSYEEAQEIIETGVGDYSVELTTLNSVAKNLKEERFRNGAISFETEEVKFRLDKEGKPLEVYKKVRKDAHKLVEEFMLMANKRVATLVNTKYKPYSIPYRLHEPPVPNKMMDFAATASRFGFKINTDSEDEYIKSINAMIVEIEGTMSSTILQPLAVRSMEKAFYTSKKSGHFGLGFDYYAHFTSPIRRYPDLLAHRYLFKMLKKVTPIDQAGLEAACKWSSDREQLAVEAERASIKFKQTEYLSQYIGTEFEGIITGITEWGIFVEIIENKCEGMIRLRDMADDSYEFFEKGRYVMGFRKKIKHQMGDIVNIRVKRTNIPKRLVDFEFVL
jgi:ribonuclease R